MIQSQKQTIHIGPSNGSATLKYICEVCGELFDSIDFLKQHLSVHATNSKLVLNSKISSILSFAKNKKICSSAISIPQSMTVFNLKDISSKIGTSQIASQTTTVTSPPIINTNANILQNKNDTLTKADHNHNHNHNNDQNNNSCVFKTVYQLEEPINFYELKNEKLINLTPSILGANQQLAFFQSSELAGSSPNLAQFTSLPYHYSENESIYVCNLCNCTYDSLRSIKAHLWKHSGHRELSYPINDHGSRIAESTGKPIVTLKAETSRKTIRSLQVPMSQTAADKTKPSEGDKCEQVRQSGGSGGGICSALLQVIEKLRETESEHKEAKPSKRKCHTSDKVEASKEPKMRKKRKTSQKVNQLIQIQDQINMNNIKQQEVIKNMLSNQEQECRIETSVVNSLYEDDDDCLLLNNPAKQQDSVESSTFVCHLCHTFAKDMYQHQCVDQGGDQGGNQGDDHGGDQNEHDKTLDEHYAIYMCHLCASERPMVGYHKQHQAEHSFYFKYFEDVNLLKSHFESEHCVKNEKSIAESSGQSLPNDDLKVTNLSLFTNVSKKNCDMIKLLELLANNDGCEQYVCGLCPYVCHHLPSLKSHMWSHVTNDKFDYSINTSIINAALDYETKISRSLALINNSIRFRKSFCSDDSKEDSDSASESDELNFSLDKKIEDTLQMINFREMEKKCLSDGHAEPKKLNKSIVAFRCSKCSFETVDLCILRLHKRNH